MERLDLVKKFFEDIREGETIRIVSGEGYWKVVNLIEPILEKAYDNKKAKILIIIGPVVSVEDDYKNRDEGNAYLRLAKKGKATLFCSPYRQRFHYKIKGNMAVMTEDYHNAIADHDKRKSHLFADKIVADNYIWLFDNYVDEFNLKKMDVNSCENPFIFLKDAEIEKLKNKLKEMSKKGFSDFELGLNYDFLTYDDIIKLLNELGIAVEDKIELRPLGLS